MDPFHVVRLAGDAVTRLFGVRDLALAVATAQPDPDTARTALRADVVIDSVDTVSGLPLARARRADGSAAAR